MSTIAKRRQENISKYISVKAKPKDFLKNVKQKNIKTAKVPGELNPFFFRKNPNHIKTEIAVK